MLTELVDKINAYLAYEMSLSELELWEANNLEVLIMQPLSREADLVAELELCLAEYSARIRSELEIREALESALLAQTIYKNYPQSSEISFTMSSTPITYEEFVYSQEISSPYRVVQM